MSIDLLCVATYNRLWEEADTSNAGARMQMIKNSKKSEDKQSNRNSQNIHQLVPHRDTPYTCTLAPSNAHEVLRQLELAALQSHARGNPKLDHLISLTKLNVQYAPPQQSYCRACAGRETHLAMDDAVLSVAGLLAADWRG